MKVFLNGVGPFLGGTIFSLGLGISGMTEPSKVISFLDIFGNWDPSLIFVMIGAIGVTAVTYRLVLKRSAPIFEKKFFLPTKKEIDRDLLLGATLFGIGWGVTGLCPGPGLASIVTGKAYALTFVGSLLVGMFLLKVMRSMQADNIPAKGK